MSDYFSEVKKPTILLVDDLAENIDILKSILQKDYRIKAATSGERAIDICINGPLPSAILLDIMMPGLDGYETCIRLKNNAKTKNIPIIFVTAKDNTEDESYGFSLGAVDYITKPIRPSIVKARLKAHLALSNQALHLEYLVDQRTKELENTRLELIHCLGKAAEFKDNETGLHVVRMSHYSKILAMKASGNNVEWSNLVFNAAPMHDIGKIGIPDNVLLKPGKLNEDEWKVMQRHAEYGAQILGDQPSALLQLAKEIAITHHERWDGTGYPNGLKGKEIPLSGRVTAVADVFDALTSVRPYKKSWSFEDAADHILNSSGTHFDPSICDSFSASILEFKEVFETYGHG